MAGTISVSSPMDDAQASLPVDPVILNALRALEAKWRDVRGSERTNCAVYVGELCAALGVDGPSHAGSGYEYEFPVKVVSPKGESGTKFVDLFKRDHFLLEAKHSGPRCFGEMKLRRAFGQVWGYVNHISGNVPPYLLVLDIARTIMVWDRWDGSFGDFGAGRRISLPTLHERPRDIALLRDIWTRPSARDPRGRARAITKEIASKLARLATSLEERGYDQERVSRFLMRCVFTMFAEDVRLLKGEPFRRMIEEDALANPAEFVPAANHLWRAMDRGTRFGSRRLLRFNGRFFADAKALPLTREDLVVLLEAAKADWTGVEPAIFGTLLTRALDPKERHRVGAEYTPPELIARVIRPTVEEPIRERWTAVQKKVFKILKRGRGLPAVKSRAAELLREFLCYLRAIHFLDPACGSGNFLYVAMHIVKLIEVEVFNELSSVTGTDGLRFEEVNPSQFHGIEINQWARQIAELTLWIGFHQFWRRTHGDIQPQEPILKDTKTLFNRDAVLDHGGVKRDPDRDRPDPTPRLAHQVTGKLVPDPSSKREYGTILDSREAEWPPAEFIIGNPPYMGHARQRRLLGDGYVDALRAAYPEVPDAADLVMYWWYKAAKEVASGRTIRAGLITTQSITQEQNRAVIADAEAKGARVVWAIADHPWNGGAKDARVRVAMTVIARDPGSATLVRVDSESEVVETRRVRRINADLTAHVDVAAAARVALLANEGLSAAGYKLHGTGFVVQREEAGRLLAADPRLAAVLKPYRNGKDFTTRPRCAYLVDFGLMSEEEARRFPVLYDIVRDRVKPERDANSRAVYAKLWWRFGEARRELRAASTGLARYIAAPETAKHRLFELFSGDVAPDNSLIAIAVDDAFILGVLSSAIHATWALAAGSRLGIDGTPRYNKGPCFEAFPFPDPAVRLRAKIASLAEQIDAHRKAALARGEKIGMTLMYNVIDRLRSGKALTKAEREVHEMAACGTLRDLHDELDRVVAEAYGWSWPEPPAVILKRLVALHNRRVREERAGRVRWLRPEYQIGRFARKTEAEARALEAGEGSAVAVAAPISRGP